MKDKFKTVKSLLSPLAVTLCNLLIAYVVYFLARLIYFFENYSYFSQNLSFPHVLEMLRGGLVFDTSAILVTNIPYIVLMLFPIHYKESAIYQKLCRAVFLIINGLALAINLCDAVYFRFTMRRTTTTVFSEFANEENLGGVFLKETINHLYLLVLFVVMVWAMYRLYRMTGLKYKELTWWHYDLATFLSLAALAPFVVAGIRGGFATAVRPITISNANQYVDRPTDAALVLNTPFSLYRTIGKAVFVVPEYYQNEAEMASVFTPIHVPNDSVPMTKKNVVVLIVESFGREYIGALNGTLENSRYRGYTPSVDSLIAKSITFSHSYCNGRKSIDGMPSILSSIPCFVEPFFLTPASMNHVSGIASLLVGEGYQTAFFHGAQRGSMGTASSHHPYVIPEKYKDVYPEEGLTIHKCIRYTDMAIGRFFQEASRQPWFKNTIFVLTSDHTNQSDHMEYQTDLGGFCSPIIIYEPGVTDHQPEMQQKIAQQIDILPTLMGRLHYPKPYFAFGIDVLNTPAEQTWAVNYMNGFYQYVKHGHVIQFDGQKTTAAYALTDSLMQNNLVNQLPEQPQMEREVKAIVQQYMERMTQDRLQP